MEDWRTESGHDLLYILRYPSMRQPSPHEPSDAAGVLPGAGDSRAPAGRVHSRRHRLSSPLYPRAKVVDLVPISGAPPPPPPVAASSSAARARAPARRRPLTPADAAAEKERQAEREAFDPLWAEQHAVMSAARKAEGDTRGWVFSPATFDVTVAPGEDVQAAVRRCPRRGSVLLQPGTHVLKKPLRLRDDQELSLFGRGLATLLTEAGGAIVSIDSDVMLDGIIFRCEDLGVHGTLFSGGRLRLQACDVSARRVNNRPPTFEAAAAEKRRGEERAAYAPLWEEQHAKRAAARAAGADTQGWVFEPDFFDVTVAPGEDVQAAVRRCPLGGSVLLLPGSHKGPLRLRADRSVHVFGRGQATLWAATDSAIISNASEATVDGIVLRCEATGWGWADTSKHGVLITGGRLRVQACDISSTHGSGETMRIEGGDPVIIGCTCVALGWGRFL